MTSAAYLGVVGELVDRIKQVDAFAAGTAAGRTGAESAGTGPTGPICARSFGTGPVGAGSVGAGPMNAGPMNAGPWTGRPVDAVGQAVACPLAAVPESVRAAREFTRYTLRGWRITGLWDELSYVVSELVTNAYRHGVAAGDRGRAQLSLRLSRAQTHVICAVQDPSDRVPVRRTPDFVSESGRGLHLVESLSTMWGSTPMDRGGKAVWALFTV